MVLLSRKTLWYTIEKRTIYPLIKEETSMHYQCLIIDDEIELAKATSEYFNLFDIATAFVTSEQEFDSFEKDNSVDLILLDINLGGDSGFQLCKKIRRTSDIPILFISARQSDDDVLVALNIGGDDYIKKPYTLSILLAKVKAMLKRIGTQPQEIAADLACEDYVLHPDTLRVTCRGEEIQLKSREFALLACLVAHKGTIMTKDQLFEEVWEDGFYSDGTLNVHIRKLREKLEKNPNEPEHIKTVWGTGYIFE